MILVTGATGLLGAHLLARLAGEGRPVAALRRADSNMKVVQEIFSYSTKGPDVWMERIDWRTGDMMDAESLGRALEGVDVVVNCAAIVSFDPKDRQKLIKNNEEGIKNLVQEIKKKEPGLKIFLVHISSTSALGDGPGDDVKFLIDEETPRDLKRWHNGYSVSKYASEQVVWKAIREQGLEAVILNPGIILGPGQWYKGSSQLFTQAFKGLKFFSYGGTGYVDVRDVVEVIERARRAVPVRDPAANSLLGERFILVGANLRYKEFFDRVTDEFGKPNPTVFAGPFMTELAWRLDTLRARVMGKTPLITRDTARSAQRIAFFSSEKVKKTLDFEFRPIEETFAWVCDLYKEKMGVR